MKGAIIKMPRSFLILHVPPACQVDAVSPTRSATSVWSASHRRPPPSWPTQRAGL